MHQCKNCVASWKAKHAPADTGSLVPDNLKVPTCSGPLMHPEICNIWLVTQDEREGTDKPAHIMSESYRGISLNFHVTDCWSLDIVTFFTGRNLNRGNSIFIAVEIIATDEVLANMQASLWQKSKLRLFDFNT